MEARVTDGKNGVELQSPSVNLKRLMLDQAVIVDQAALCIPA